MLPVENALILEIWLCSRPGQCGVLLLRIVRASLEPDRFAVLVAGNDVRDSNHNKRSPTYRCAFNIRSYINNRV